MSTPELSFKDIIAADNAKVFINGNEFADAHNLNGVECLAVVQDVSTAEKLSIGLNADNAYPGLYGSRVMVTCKAADLPSIPVFGMAFELDGQLYTVEACDEDMGLLTIQLIGNER